MEKYLKLSTTIQENNMHLFTANDKIKTAELELSIIGDFILKLFIFAHLLENDLVKSI